MNIIKFINIVDFVIFVTNIITLERRDNMSLFKPSNLTPNFESVVYNQPLTLTFQVNSNGSRVTAYRVQILTDFNDKDDSDKNIIGTIYGAFNTPLYNKDIGEILLTQETLKYNGIFLEPNKDYRWRLRLYGEVKNQSNTVTERDAPEYILPETTTYNAIRGIDICKDFDIKGNTYYSTAENKSFLVIAQEDIGSYLVDIMNRVYSSIQDFYEELYEKNNKFYIYTSSIADKTEKERIDFFKNKIHPVIYVYQFILNTDGTLSYPLDSQYTIKYSYINYYTNNEDMDLTYVGSGNLVGSTKQVMWTRQYNPYMKINSYAQLLITVNRMDFQPFLPENSITIERLTEEGMSGPNYVTVSKSCIKKEYLKEITNGNFYLLLFNEKSPTIAEGDMNDFLTMGLAKRIVSVENYNEGMHIRIYTSDYEEIQDYSDANYKYLSLFYIQRQKIIQVDKNIGENNLVKITFKKPFDYNPENDQNIYFGYVSDDFDYDRVYIEPVEEFDNSDGFSYIYIFPIGGEIKGANLSQSDIDKMIKDGKCFKIINYVSSTGEVTLYGKTSFIPTIQLQYQIFKRNAEKSYDLITGTGKNAQSNGTAFLGGRTHSDLPLISNHSVDGRIFEGTVSDDRTAIFDMLFIQPNIGIKNDVYHPNVLEIYNQKYKNRLCITNLYNEYYLKKYQHWVSTENIDKLDDTMYYITAKNVDNYDYYLGSYGKSGNAYTLYNPQTQYKIYSNFVDCVPEGFFYSRYDKTIKFEIYDLNTRDSEIEQKVYISKNGKIYLDDTEVNYVSFRDLYIKTICQDSYKDNDGNLVELDINNVPLKEYHYEIMTEDGAVVYSTKETYDGKFSCEFRGCNEDSVYYIKVYIEDNFGKLYTYQAKIPISYDKLTDNTNITITPLCEQQAIKVDFAPIKQIKTSGKLVYQEPYIVANSGGDYPTFYEFDEGKNSINIPNNFSYAMQFELNSSMLDRNEELQLLVIETDNHAVYILYIDTRPYLIIDGVYSLNKNYMKFRIEGRNTASGVNKIIGDYTGYSDFVKPTQFAYAMSTSSEVNSKYIYILPESIDKVASEYREVFFNTVPKSCRDLDTDGVTLKSNTLKLYNEDTATSGDEVYVVSNTDQYTISNKQTIENMSVLTFRLTINDTNGTIDNNDVTCSIT